MGLCGVLVNFRSNMAVYTIASTHMGFMIISDITIITIISMGSLLFFVLEYKIYPKQLILIF